MQTITAKQFQTGTGQYGIVIDHNRVVFPITSVVSPNPLTVILGEESEIHGEATLRGIAWPRPPMPPPS